MKYSILVLGATISISLFIRLCGCLEANNQDKMEDLFSGRADDVFERFLKFSLLDGVKDDAKVPDVEHIVDEWIRDIRLIRKEFPLAKSAPVRLTSSQGINENIFNPELCGNVNPPELKVPDCTQSDDCSCEIATELPPGCDFDETAQYMWCNDKKITDVPSLPPQLNILDLNDTQIEKISENEFRNVTIKTIRMFRNKIDYIHPWAFHDVDNLDTLMITGNKINYLAYELYVGMDSATFVDLQRNQISFEIYRACPILPEDQIAKVLPSLRWLQLSGNPLTTIPRQMFAGLRSSPLISLYLDNCYLQDIDEEAFTYLQNLTILNLSNNPSQLVYPLDKFARILRPLTSLYNIYLADLGLYEIPVDALSHLFPVLKVLDLSNNKLHTIKQDALSNFTALEELYLDDSSIQIIEPNAFAGNKKLRSLSIKRNVMQQLPTYFPPTIKFLILTNVELDSSSKPSLNFQNITALTHLEVSAIKIDSILNTTLQGLHNLHSLFLGECGIQSIENGAFLDLTKLQFLKLDDNDISEVRPETFMGLESLIALSLKNCKLFFASTTASSSPPPPQSLLPPLGNDSPFSVLTNLKTLHLTGNNIVHVSANLFQNLPSLCYIDLGDNPVESWDARLFPERTHTIYEFNPNFTCNLQLFIPNGNVQFMKPAMLQDFLSMRTIDFSNNILVCDEGACKLRDVIAKSLTTPKQTWLNHDTYKCKDILDGKLLLISELTDPICSRSFVPPPSTPEGSFGAQTTLIAVVASLSLITAVVLVLAYKNRAHLRYFWFSFKFNVMPVTTPRKAKLSTMEDPSTVSSYDYDVFISYHQDDSKFIEDVFLPEIEQQNDTGEETEIYEAKNFVYIIEDDEKLKSYSNNNSVKPNPSAPRFKVCIHERDFEVGVPITENIVDCVDRSRKTVIFVSKKYLESQWCSFEMNLAYHRLVESRRRSFVLVLLEDVPSQCRTKVLNYLMVSKTYLQWPGVVGLEEEKASFWKRLRAFLQSS